MSWASLRETTKSIFDGYKKEQRRAIVMSLIAKRNGIDLDYLLTADYATLTKILNQELFERLKVEDIAGFARR